MLSASLGQTADLKSPRSPAGHATLTGDSASTDRGLGGVSLNLVCGLGMARPFGSPMLAPG